MTPLRANIRDACLVAEIRHTKDKCPITRAMSMQGFIRTTLRDGLRVRKLARGEK